MQAIYDRGHAHEAECLAAMEAEGWHIYGQQTEHVIDCGDGRIEGGLLGPCGELAPTLYYLFGLGMRRIEGAAE